MKTNPLVALIVLGFIGLLGCSTEPPPKPAAPRPFVGILSVEKLDKGKRESSRYDVALYYDHVEPEKYEIKVGFGYDLPAEARKKLGNSSEGIYAVAHSEVLHKTSGDIRVTIEPTAVRNMHASMDGQVYVLLSKYPHGKEWIVVSHGVFTLPPP